jgi:hypothetical protein
MTLWGFYIFHNIGPTDLFHPSLAPHFKTFKVFPIYFPKCPNFSNIHAITYSCYNILHNNVSDYDYQLLLFFPRAACEPAHSNGCGPLPEKVGLPYIRCMLQFQTTGINVSYFFPMAQQPLVGQCLLIIKASK